MTADTGETTRGEGPYGRGISDAMVRRLEHAGTLSYVGVDRYALKDGVPR